MRRWFWLLALAGCASNEGYSRGAFERHIVFLASDELRGRDNGTDEGRRAAQYVADQFRDIGLRPVADGSYFHDFEAKGFTGAMLRGRNVAGLVPGADLAAEFVVVAAHHDARGVIGGRVQNGADDNASGVALVIELARAFARQPARRTLVFVSFDAEEDGLIGSREYVKAGVQDPACVAAMFVFDVIGGDFMPWETRRVYALGSEYSREMHERVGRLAAGERELEVERTPVYPIEVPFPRSDYAAYRAAKVPFVFLSTGTPWYYHTEHDDPEIINYPKLVGIAAFVQRLIRETADDPARPAFVANPQPDVAADARRMKGVAERMLAMDGLKDRNRAALQKAVQDLDAIIAQPTPEGAKKIKTLMGAFFGVVMSQRPRVPKDER